jgi:hypothetical protein
MPVRHSPPAAPAQHGPTSPASARDPRLAELQIPQVLVWGAHGGAGTSTLTGWLWPAYNLGAMRPGLYPRYPVQLANGRPLVVACRSTVSAAIAATSAVVAVTRAGGHVSVLAVVSDGWPEPALAAARFRLLEPQAGAIIAVPFVPGMRLADDPALIPVPRLARRAIDQIRAAAGLEPLPRIPDLPGRS